MKIKSLPPPSTDLTRERSLFSQVLIILTFLLFGAASPSGAQINLQLTPSNYNGYHISCFGFSDGSIDLQVTGGMPPYLIVWSTNDTLEDLSGIPAGYYRVRVTDSDSIPLAAEAEITLTEPRQLEISAAIHTYPNKYNISVFEACNGMLSVTGDGGVAPYSWWWADSSTQTVRNALCADQYKLTLTDDNGCQLNEKYILTQPERSDWQITGNEGTDPGVNFIGTTDSADLVFRTNNTESLRITSSGDLHVQGKLKIDSTSADSLRMVFVDSSGFMRTYAPPADWNTKGNVINDQEQFIGTLNGADLVFKTGNGFTFPVEAMRINQAGSLGIGTTTIPAGYKLVVEGHIGAREVVVVKPGDPWPDYVFKSDYSRKSLEELKEFITDNHHLPGMPSALEIEGKGGLELGRLQIKHLEKTEEAFLYILELKEEIEQLKEALEIMKTSIEKRSK